MCVIHVTFLENMKNTSQYVLFIAQKQKKI